VTYSAATVTVIAVLSLINTALTLGVIRRLGELRWSPSPTVGGGAEAPPMTVKPGSRIGDFAVTAVDGGTVSRADLVGPTLVAFLAPGCPACDFSVPAFLERAERAPGGRDHVLAVLMGSPRYGEELRERLAPVARVLTEEHEGGPLVRAFGVLGLPAFGLLSDDRMVVSHPLPEQLPEVAAA
jgi:peroxiredoxin